MEKEQFVAHIEQAWQQLRQFARNLPPAILSGPSDAAGWRVQDHLAHLAIWEASKVAVLQGQNRDAFIGVPVQDHSDDFAAVNEHIRARTASLAGPEVLALLEDTHAQLLLLLAALPAQKLNQPIGSAYPNSGMPGATPVWQVIAGDTYEHYQEHLPWMQAIVDRRAGRGEDV